MEEITAILLARFRSTAKWSHVAVSLGGRTANTVLITDLRGLTIIFWTETRVDTLECAALNPGPRRRIPLLIPFKVHGLGPAQAVDWCHHNFQQAPASWQGKFLVVVRSACSTLLTGVFPSELPLRESSMAGGQQPVPQHP